MNADLLWLGIAGALALASIAFSALETAVFIMNAGRRRTLIQRDAACASKLDALLDHPSEMGNALLIADTLVDVPLIVLCIHFLHRFEIGDDFPAWGGVGIALLVVIVLCDLAPKLVALAAPIQVTRLGMPVATWLLPVLGPLCSRLARWSEIIVGVLIPKRVVPLPILTEEELDTLIEIGREEGALNETETRIIHQLNKLTGKTAKHCMTPRVDAFTIRDDLSNQDAAALVRRRRYRYVPVRGETPDDIVGIMDVEAFLLAPEIPYTELLRPPSFVPETMNVLDLLQSFLRHRQGMAILLDEFGGIEGIVTLTDIIEELMGHEGPAQRAEIYIEEIGGGRLLASGSARLDDLSERLGFDVEEEGVDTVGGLIIERLGFLPRPGSWIVTHGWKFIVQRATRKRIKEVMIEPIGDGGEAET